MRHNQQGQIRFESYIDAATYCKSMGAITAHIFQLAQGDPIQYVFMDCNGDEVGFFHPNFLSVEGMYTGIVFEKPRQWHNSTREYLTLYCTL